MTWRFQVCLAGKCRRTLEAEQLKYTQVLLFRVDLNKTGTEYVISRGNIEVVSHARLHTCADEQGFDLVPRSVTESFRVF